jgi:Na+-transporting methylmalonyl-CoA/oxaloacetate decarboxylase gamma subunit
MELSYNVQEGLVILFVGMGIVFLSLLLLNLIFRYVIPPLLSFNFRKIVERLNEKHETVIEKKYDTAEEIAAVTAAVHLFLNETHDEESGMMTISKSAKDYSPWSSKIYATHNIVRTPGRR